jgi:hypothetical protein
VPAEQPNGQLEVEVATAQVFAAHAELGVEVSSVAPSMQRGGGVHAHVGSTGASGGASAGGAPSIGGGSPALAASIGGRSDGGASSASMPGASTGLASIVDMPASSKLDIGICGEQAAHSVTAKPTRNQPPNPDHKTTTTDDRTDLSIVDHARGATRGQHHAGYERFVANLPRGDPAPSPGIRAHAVNRVRLG